jgi:hypothetical protein
VAVSSLPYFSDSLSFAVPLILSRKRRFSNSVEFSQLSESSQKTNVNFKFRAETLQSTTVSTKYATYNSCEVRDSRELEMFKMVALLLVLTASKLDI